MSTTKDGSGERFVRIVAHVTSVAIVALVMWTFTAVPIAVFALGRTATPTMQLAVLGGSYLAWATIITIVMWWRIWRKKRRG